MSERYQQLREQAIDINNRSLDINGCISGSGECCKSNVPMTDGDIEAIETAIRERKIPQQIIDHAKESATDETDTRCPFLSKTNRCLIYSYRPLVCAIWGLGGTPDELNVAVDFRKDGTHIPGYLSRDVKLYTCHGCYAHGNNPNIFMPQEIIDKADEIKRYVERNKTTSTRNFVLEHLQEKSE